MSKQHTPGPWAVFGGKSAGVQDCFYIHSEAEPLAPRIVTVFANDGAERAQANARLISAAPDLISIFTSAGGISPDEMDNAADIAEAENSYLARQLRGAAAAARATIAKARGES